MATQRKVAEAVVEGLVRHGIRDLFCLPGVQNDELFAALHDAGDAIRCIHARHEQGAAYMALGAAQATGRPAAFSVVPGPGVLNASAALATAYAVCAPVLCLAGQIPLAAQGKGFGMLHEIPDQLAILRQLTKWADRVTVPGEVNAKLDAAFRALRSGRPRPVALEVSLDVFAASGEFDAPDATPPDAAPVPGADDLARAAALLADARRPLIVVGGGAQGAPDQVRRIAERLQAPVTCFRMGRGVLDSRHPLSFTGPHGHRFWADADVVLGIGSRLTLQGKSWGVDGDLKFVTVNIDAGDARLCVDPEVALVGDAAPVLDALLERLGPRPADAPSRVAEIAASAAVVDEEIAKLSPQTDYLDAIRAALPEDGILVEELTQPGYVARMHFPVYAPRTFISSGYQGTLGGGFATALGVKVARPEAPVVAIAGDGGFMYTMPELATAVQHGIATVTVVFNNNAFGNVKLFQQQHYGGRVIASDLVNPDFVHLAESFGAIGLRATNPDQLEAAVAGALDAERPVLIEVPLGDVPDPWPLARPARVRG